MTGEISAILSCTSLFILYKSALIAYDFTGKIIENIEDGRLIKAGASFYAATEKISFILGIFDSVIDLWSPM